MAYDNPTITDFKNYFVRDFPYGSDPTTSVIDQDIANALALSDVNFNQRLWNTQSNFSLGFLYLTAHYLVENLRASSQGISGQFNWLQSSKSVGSVSEAFSIPQRILDNPEFAILTKTSYGARYLELLLPKLAGQIFTVCGGTNP